MARRRFYSALLPDGRRLHLQDGPIDLIIEAFGADAEISAAYRAANHRFDGLLDELCEELAELRAPVRPGLCRLKGQVARRMHEAVSPYAADCFVTPMAAVAGAVAEEILGAMLDAAALRKAYVNNGGDIALHLAPGGSFSAGLIDRPDQPSLFARARITAESGIAGIATSGWRGRSFSLGIADAVTVLAATASVADVAATIIANAVDLPDHPGVVRLSASSLQPDSDLGEIPVTRGVPCLSTAEIATALDSGMRRACGLVERGHIIAAALHLQDTTRTVGLSEPALLQHRELIDA
jgi:uncharacterized protein